MTFWLKKMVSGFLLPLPFGLIWFAAGLLLLMARCAPRLRNITFIIGFLVITIFSFNPVSTKLLNKLQSQYAPLTQVPTGVTQVVVLGGGVNDDQDYPANITLGSASLSRLVEGIRQFKALAANNINPTLILSGGQVFGSPTAAGKMQNVATLLGVNPSNIILENGSQDTHQEALFLKKTLGSHPFILVTSAYHMPRSMALFEHQGMHPIAAPTEILSSKTHTALFYIPNASSLIMSNIALHEYIGILWAKMQGYIAR
jgi:uncharacterized SAM-binding protein YcdF (DUF218 family)